ncbi:MAG: glycoside hydrolase family 3 protein, partial [Planctomycetes bacterium]|nr:glycoside hydrolase family 3 protein [Planctomycetota bacterium]
SINAGLDMIMIPYGPGQKNSYVDFTRLLKELVAEGKVPQARVDDAVRRILRVKLQMHLFEHPLRVDPALTEQVGSPEHRQVARECVRQSLVLLKNDHQVLPLSKQVKRLCVAGAAADDLGLQCGGWTISWQGKTGKVIRGGTTILAGLRQAAPHGMEVSYSPDGTGARRADAVLVVLGEKPYAETLGDRKDLHLPAADRALVDKVKAAGVPVITVLLSGRPLILGSALEKSDAFVAAWLPGTEGGGVADVLFGTVQPTGKLPQTWPRDMDQVPPHPGSQPLFPYGFGLAYP